MKRGIARPTNSAPSPLPSCKKSAMDFPIICWKGVSTRSEKQREDKKDNKGEPPEFALPLFKLLEAGREDGALVSVLCRPAGGLLGALVVFVHESGRTPQNRESSASKTYIHCRKASRISAIKAVKWSS